MCCSLVVKEKPTFESPFWGAFPSDRIPTAMKDVSVHFSIQGSNSYKLYNRIPEIVAATTYNYLCVSVTVCTRQMVTVGPYRQTGGSWVPSALVWGMSVLC